MHTDLDFAQFMCQGYYTQTMVPGMVWKDGALTIQSILGCCRGDNPDLGFVKRKEFSIGLDGSFQWEDW